MFFDEKYSTLRIRLVQVSVFVLIVTIYSLNEAIFNATYVWSASIASSQFAGDGFSDSHTLSGVLNLILIGLFICASASKLYLLILGLVYLVFNSISETIFFEFTSCFYFPSNAIVVARSILVILLMIIIICFAVFTIVHFFLSTDKGKSGAFLAFLLIPPSIVILYLNVILIPRLKPQLNYTFKESSLKLGFFNPIEMSQIQNGNYVKTSTFEQQIIGNLGDVTRSTNKERVCSHKGCSSYYLRKYLYQITCANQSVPFYKDCVNASSLTIYVTYLDSGPYPSYNCLVDQTNETCSSLCTQLLSTYKLILIQEFKPNRVEPAWAGLSKCDTNINNQLTHNSTLNPCS